MADDKKGYDDTLVLTEGIELYQQPTGTVFGVRAPRLEHIPIPRLQDVEIRPNVTLGQWEDIQKEDPIETAVYTPAVKVSRPVVQAAKFEMSATERTLQDTEVALPSMVATGPRVAKPNVELPQVLYDDTDRTQYSGPQRKSPLMLMPEEGIPIPPMYEKLIITLSVVGVVSLAGMLFFFFTR